MEKKDEQLILEYQQSNDEMALVTLFNRYKAHILNFALRILGNRADAEDVTSDCFLTLFKKRYIYRAGTKFSTWLFTVARNLCINRIRKRKKLGSMWFKKDSNNYEQWDIPDEKDIADTTLEKTEASMMVKKAILKLPEEQKEALILREYHNMNYADISEIMSCSLEKVKILIFRAREQLKVELSSFILEGEND